MFFLEEGVSLGDKNLLFSLLSSAPILAVNRSECSFEHNDSLLLREAKWDRSGRYLVEATHPSN